jgi:ABC-type dipeptide/oligopeptide/nickel transport system permease component
MNKIILLLLSILLLSYSSHAAFPIATNQTNTDQQVEAVAFEDTTQQHGFAQMAFGQYKHRIQKLLKNKQTPAPKDIAWMGPLSFGLMFTIVGIPFGMILAIIALSSKSNKNKGWAIAALLLIPAIILLYIVILIVGLYWLTTHH